MVPEELNLRGPSETRYLQRDRGVARAVATGRERIALVDIRVAAMEVGAEPNVRHVVVVQGRARADRIVLGVERTVADLMQPTVGELSGRPHADPAQRGATQIVALRGIDLARLAQVIARLVRSHACARRGITAVRLQWRAVQIDAERQLGVPVVNHLALLHGIQRPDANAPLNLSSVQIQTLRRGAGTPPTPTSEIIATRISAGGHLAEVVVEGVLS